MSVLSELPEPGKVTVDNLRGLGPIRSEQHALHFYQVRTCYQLGQRYRRVRATLKQKRGASHRSQIFVTIDRACAQIFDLHQDLSGVYDTEN